MRRLVIALLMLAGVASAQCGIQAVQGNVTSMCMMVDYDLLRSMGLPIPPMPGINIAFQSYAKTTDPRTEAFLFSLDYTHEGKRLTAMIVHPVSQFYYTMAQFMLSRGDVILAYRVQEITSMYEFRFSPSM
jgi:hypothetical protein